MSVNIIKKADFSRGILARDMKDGHAYMDEAGVIYIGNSFEFKDKHIKGFSVCGDSIAWEYDEASRYIEIDLDIIVK